MSNNNLAFVVSTHDVEVPETRVCRVRPRNGSCRDDVYVEEGRLDDYDNGVSGCEYEVSNDSTRLTSAIWI